MTAKPFFITGLPRSRTAWMSVFTTTGDSICYHEPITKIHEIEDLKGIFSSDYYKYVGVSDSGLGFHLKWILENIKAPTVIIDRDIDECNSELEKLSKGRLPKTNFCELLHKELVSFKDHPLVMWVPFKEMKKKSIMGKVFCHLMPDVTFDELRFEELDKLNIQVIFDDVLEFVREQSENMSNIMKDIQPRIRRVG